MRRRSLTTTCALLLALAPAPIFAQDPAAQPPAQAQPPAAPKLAFTTNAGMLLIQIKKDQTAAFEELMAKIKAGGAKTTDEAVKKQLAAFKVYKSSEDMGGNALYVVLVDPATPNVEYELFMILQKVLTPEELRDAAVIEMSKKAAAAFAQGYNKLNLTPLGGGM
jgi:arginine repressor